MRRLISAIFKTGLGSALSIAFGALAVKILALLVGPSGIGLFSLLRQIQQTGSGIASVGGYTALVQGIASRSGEQRVRYVFTAAHFFAVGIMLVSIAMVVLAPQLTWMIYGSRDPQLISVLRWLAIPCAIGGISSFFIAILNGYGAIGDVAFVTALTSIVAAACAYPAGHFVRQGHSAAFVVLLGVSLTASAAYGIWRSIHGGWLREYLAVRPEYCWDSARQFSSFALTTFAASMMTTGSGVVLRAMVLRRGGLASTGILDAAWTISMTYVLLSLTSFSTYYLPVLSGTHERPEQHLLMRRLLRASVLIMVPMICAMIVCKPLLMTLLYTHEFAPSLMVLRWMLIGDYIKVASWALAMPMLAYADMRAFFWSEVITKAALIGLAAISVFGFSSVEGVGVAFLVSYVGYFSFTLLYVRKRLALRFNLKEAIFWFAGLGVIVIASSLTWQARTIQPIPALAVAILAVAFAFITTGKEERKQLLMLLTNRGVGAAASGR
jgi:O-antigen/teichoic acid export membrane protein